MCEQFQTSTSGLLQISVFIMTGFFFAGFCVSEYEVNKYLGRETCLIMNNTYSSHDTYYYNVGSIVEILTGVHIGMTDFILESKKLSEQDYYEYLEDYPISSQKTCYVNSCPEDGCKWRLRGYPPVSFEGLNIWVPTTMFGILLITELALFTAWAFMVWARYMSRRNYVDIQLKPVNA